MQMKKLFALVLVLLLTVSSLNFASAAEENAVYQLGDRMEDFTVTMTNGQEISLYGLLKEKKVVVLNFWASWCGPCKTEFPYLQEVYDKMGADVGFIALSINDGDTAEVIENLKADLGVTTIPTGRDIGLAARFNVHVYPTSVIIDKNGVVCLVHEGIITSARLLKNALDAYISDDYDKPLLLEKIPELPITQAAGAAELSAAMNMAGGTLEFVSVESEETLWPFIPAADGKSALASNGSIQNSTANAVTGFEAKAGDILLYDVRMTGEEYQDRLLVMAGSDIKKLYTGTFDQTTCALPIEADGEQVVTFVYVRGSQAGYDALCEVRNVRLITGEEAAAYEMPNDSLPKVLESADVSVEVIGSEDMPPMYLMDANGNNIYGTPLFRLANADSVRVKICIGKDVETTLCGLILVTDLVTKQVVMLSSMEHDDEAYYYDVDLTRGVSVTATVKKNVLDTMESGSGFPLCASKEKARQYYIAVMLSMFPRMTQAQIDAIGYYKIAMEDGTVVCDSDEIWEIYQQSLAAKAPEKPVFTITFVSSDGTPVQGVMAQICDDATCTVLPSDDQGKVTFEGENHQYELHVLMAPVGFTVPNGSITLPINGGEISVVLEKTAQ